MSRRGWIIVLVAGGIGLAILIGVLGTRNEDSGPTKAQATSSLCASLQTLETSVKNLTSLSSSSSKSNYQADVTAVQNAWKQVQTDFQSVQNASEGDLDSAWNNFESAVKAVPDSASVSDAVNSVTQSADALSSAAKTTASEVNCSSS